jgi:hypothetical protein
VRGETFEANGTNASTAVLLHQCRQSSETGDGDSRIGDIVFRLRSLNVLAESILATAFEWSLHKTLAWMNR